MRILFRIAGVLIALTVLSVLVRKVLPLVGGAEGPGAPVPVTVSPVMSPSDAKVTIDKAQSDIDAAVKAAEARAAAADR